MTKPPPTALLGRASLFRNLPDAQLVRLAAAARIRRLTKGELLFQKGDRPAGLFLVLAGQIKEACQSPAGEEKIIEILGPHQTCGEAALFLDCPYPFFVAALTPVQLLQIEGKAILDLFASEPPFVNRMMEQVSARLCTLVRDIEAYTLHSPLRRVAGYLLDNLLAPEGEAITAQLPAPKAVIASRLGITPEAMSRALRDLIDADLIAVSGRRMKILDLPRFKTFAQ